MARPLHPPFHSEETDAIGNSVVVASPERSPTIRLEVIDRPESCLVDLTPYQAIAVAKALLTAVQVVGPTEIAQATGLPYTTAWRHRLIALGRA